MGILTTVVNGIDYQSGEHVQLDICDGFIVGKRIVDVAERLNHHQGRVPFIAPGLVDLQINGYKGIDLNTWPIEVDAICRLTRYVLACGVTSYYPTVITNSSENITAIVRRIAEACESDHLVDDCIPGIHLEGPYISLQDGPRGAHCRDFVQAPDWEQLQRWQECAGGRIRLITLSPEWDNVDVFIRQCVAAGITVAIGHTGANSEQIQKAVFAGAKLSTHLGNGSHLELPRHPNYIWDQLAQDTLWASVIADGFHLPESVLRVISRVKGNQCILVSDAASLSGMPPGQYHTHIGGAVVLTNSGKLHMAREERFLAGSAQMLPEAIAHLLRSRISSLPEAWEMASIQPAKLMGLDDLASGLELGKPADLVVFDWDQNDLHIKQVFKRGTVIKPMT